MSAKFHELVALILLSVAIFIHSSKLAKIGTRFKGVVTALPPTTNALSSPSFWLPPLVTPMLWRPPPMLRRVEPRGVRGFEFGESFSRLASDMLVLRGVSPAAAARSWLSCASCRALRPCDRWAFSCASSLRGILSKSKHVSSLSQSRYSKRPSLWSSYFIGEFLKGDSFIEPDATLALFVRDTWATRGILICWV